MKKRVPKKKRGRPPSEQLAPVKAARKDPDPATLARELGVLIESAQRRVASAANAALVMLYWQIGHRICTEVSTVDVRSTAPR